MTPRSARAITFFLAVAVLLAGSGFIVLELAADWVGLSGPGFSDVQVLALLRGGQVVLVGGCLLLLRRYLTDELIDEVGRTIQRLKPDIGLAATLFGIGALVGWLYESTVRPIASEYFYQPTTPWIATAPALYGLFFGATAAVAYCTFRLGMGRALSVAFAFALIVSPTHLHNLVPALYRDYTKAPLILTLVFVMGLLLLSPVKRRNVIFLAAVAGIAAGIGLSIRQDFLVFIPPIILLLTLFLPGTLLSNLSIKATAILVFGVAMFLCSLSAFLSTGVTENGGIRALTGFMAPFNSRLGVTGTEYDWGYIHLDEFTEGLIYGQSKILQPDYKYDSISKSDYTRLGARHLLALGLNFPADVITRALAATLKILELPFTYRLPPIGLTNDWITAFYSGRSVLLRLLAGSGFFFAFAALLLIGSHSLRTAFFCLFLLLYLGSYPALQFSGRHYFHLEFITWWMVGFVIHASLQFFPGFFRAFRQGRRFAIAEFFDQRQVSLRRASVVFVILIAVATVPVAASRQYQSANVRNLLGRYANADLQVLPVAQTSVQGGSILVTSPELINKASYEEPRAVDYLAAEFSNENCSYPVVWFILRYENTFTPSGRRLDFSRSMNVDFTAVGGSSTRVFFPALSTAEHPLFRPHGFTHLQGLELPSDQVGCFRGLYRVKDPSKFPVLLTVTLPMSTERVSLFQRFTSLETNGIHMVPKDLPGAAAQDLFGRPRTQIMESDLLYRDDILQVNADRWIVSGYARPQWDPFEFPGSDRTRSRAASVFRTDVNVALIDTDLLLTKEVSLRKGSYFVAEGVLETGGVTLGLIKDGRTMGSVDVTNNGPFKVAIEVPIDGEYSLGLANNVDMYTSRENRLVISHAGWVGGATGLSSHKTGL